MYVRVFTIISLKEEYRYIASNCKKFLTTCFTLKFISFDHIEEPMDEEDRKKRELRKCDEQGPRSV